MKNIIMLFTYPMHSGTLLPTALGHKVNIERRIILGPDIY